MSRFYKYRNQIRYCFVALLSLFIVSVVYTNKVSALNDDSNASTRNAAYHFWNTYGGGQDMGALWINDVNNGPGIESDVITADANAAQITVYFHGAVKGCGNASVYGGNTMRAQTRENSGYAARDNDLEPSLTLHKDTIFRGYYNGYSNWSWGWESGAVPATLDVAKFKSGASHSFDGTYDIWTKTIYAYRCFGLSWDGYDYTGRCGGSPVTITLRSISYHDVTTEGTYSSDSYAKAGNVNEAKNSIASPFYISSSDNNNISATFSFRHIVKSGIARLTAPTWAISRKADSSGYSEFIRKSTSIAANGSSTVNSSSFSENIQLGTQKQYCQSTAHTRSAKVVEKVRNYDNFVVSSTTTYDGWVSPSSEACASAHHPYDFTTSVSANALNTILYIGESVQASGSVKNSGTHDNNNATPHTVTPSDTVSRLFQFTVNANVAADNNKLAGGTTSSDPCDFFRNKLGTGNVTCNGNLKNETGSVANGATKNLSGTVNVPDDATSLGKKICVATAINYSDSGSGYNGGLNKTWRISGASCSTVAKKPSVQVWGSVFTNGSIATATSAKSGRTYGSWAEHLVVAGKAITGFGSGASLGYAGGSYNLALPGGQASSNAASRSPLTVSNNNSNAIGTSNIITSSQLIESLKARFATPSAVSAGVEYTTSTAEFDGQIIRNSGTKIYHIDGDVTIKNDICYGSCSGSPTRLESYNLTSNQPATLPQIIIFAKNIKINDNVKRIDAWLISENNINTCANYSFGNSLSSSNCNQTLIVNGPIFAKNLQLNRTAGANSGNGTQQSGDVRAQEITDDGSIAPAEVFNLRGDAYVWSHIQAQRSNEAVTVYTRELAPRL